MEPHNGVTLRRSSPDMAARAWGALVMFTKGTDMIDAGNKAVVSKGVHGKERGRIQGVQGEGRALLTMTLSREESGLWHCGHIGHGCWNMARCPTCMLPRGTWLAICYFRRTCLDICGVDAHGLAIEIPTSSLRLKSTSRRRYMAVYDE